MPILQLIASEPLSENVSQFSFLAGFPHQAGQYLAVFADINGQPQKRYYSIASPPNADQSIELCVQHEGEFGRHLLRLQPGESVESSLPAGTMQLRSADHNTAYFASGTGIAPMRAILKEQLSANPYANATLVFGAHNSRDLLYRKELVELASRHPGFRFMPTISGEDVSWPGLRGRTIAHVDTVLAANNIQDVYFCGQQEMVEQLREHLSQTGIPEEQQIFERY